MRRAEFVLCTICSIPIQTSNEHFPIELFKAFKESRDARHGSNDESQDGQVEKIAISIAV